MALSLPNTRCVIGILISLISSIFKKGFNDTKAKYLGGSRSFLFIQVENFLYILELWREIPIKIKRFK